MVNKHLIEARTLSTLLTHPEVQRGMQDAHNAHEEGIFGDDDQEMFADLRTEDNVITFVDSELSRESCLREQEAEYESPSYWYQIGFTLAWLDQAMSYHQRQHQQKESVHP